MKPALDMLGLCARAGKLVYGIQLVEALVKRGEAHIVVMDDTASARSKKQLKDACAYYGAQIRFLEGVGRATGKPNSMAVAVTDKRMAEKVMSLLDT